MSKRGSSTPQEQSKKLILKPCFSEDAKTFDLDGHAIPYIGKPALIANKKSAGRHKDLADVEELERLREK